MPARYTPLYSITSAILALVAEIEHTIPNKPNSRLQKYRITRKAHSRISN